MSPEVYDLDHAILNIKCPDTLWLNMGYWRVSYVRIRCSKVIQVRAVYRIQMIFLRHAKVGENQIGEA